MDTSSALAIRLSVSTLELSPHSIHGLCYKPLPPLLRGDPEENLSLFGIVLCSWRLWVTVYLIFTHFDNNIIKRYENRLNSFLNDQHNTTK